MRLLSIVTVAVLFTEVAFAVATKKTTAPKKAVAAKKTTTAKKTTSPLTKPAGVTKASTKASTKKTTSGSTATQAKKKVTAAAAAKKAAKKAALAGPPPVLPKSAPITAADHSAAPIFTLACNDYADVCDNHCNAIFCHDFFSTSTSFLHFDANAGKDRPKKGSKTSADDLRRAAIGCGGSNYCSGTGKDCDEFPYASTYDGGLGCVNARFPGPDKLLQKGTTRCADASENRSHGSQLGNFYEKSGLKDARPYRIAFNKANMGNAPLCKAFMTGGAGKSACPQETTGDFRSRTTPLSKSSFCPARGQGKVARRAGFADLREEEEPEFTGNVTRVAHHITDEAGNELLIPHGDVPAVGEMVYRMGPDGEGILGSVTAVHSSE